MPGATVSRAKNSPMVDDNAADPPPGRDRQRDFDRSCLPRNDLPKLGCAVVAEQGATTGREDGRHPATMPAEFGGADAEDPAMNGMQPTSPRAMRDRTGCQPEPE